MEVLESSGVRPRQARYQAALRPDSESALLILRQFPTLLQIWLIIIAFLVPTLWELRLEIAGNADIPCRVCELAARIVA